MFKITMSSVSGFYILFALGLSKELMRTYVRKANGYFEVGSISKGTT